MAAYRPSPARRVGNRLLLVGNLVAGNAAAAFAVVGFLRPTFVGADPGASRSLLLPLETGTAWGVFLGCVALLLANFAWLVRRPERLPPTNWVLSETPSGPVRIAREALEAGLRQAGEALPEVTRLRVQVDMSTPKRLVLVGQFQCAETTNNLAASQRLRQALLDRFGAMVQTTDGVRVEVDLEFQGFAGKLGKKAAEMPAQDDNTPFTGPKYPIDDDQSLGSAP